MLQALQVPFFNFSAANYVVYLLRSFFSPATFKKS